MFLPSQNTSVVKGIQIPIFYKTKELIIPIRKKGGERAPIHIKGAELETFESITFFGVTITNNLSWTYHVVMAVKKAQQHLFFLMELRKFGRAMRTLSNFYKCIIESILS
eukprot:g34358.t1